MKARDHLLKCCCLLLAVMGLSLWLPAQSLKDVFGNADAPIFYYGIDFTKVKLIDDAAANAEDIVDRQFNGINDVVVNEPKKYDLAGAFRKSSMDHDLSYIRKRNEKTDPRQLHSTTTTDFERLAEKDIDAAVKALGPGNQQGTGLLFVAEAVSKSRKAMAIWVALFDIKTKKVLLAERLEAKMGMGFTFRNQWASCIKSAIEMIDKKKYKEWKAKYAG